MNEVESELLKILGDEKKIIFDIGCYRGNFTKNIIKHEIKKNITSSYYLFDPNPNVKEYLKNLLKSDKIKYYELALDNTSMTKKFVINRYFEASGSSLKSAHREDKLYNLSRKAFMKIFQPFKKIQDYEEIKVKTDTIDNFCIANNIDKIDLLKIDTDGTDYEVLLGAERMLSQRKIGLIYTEISGFKKNFDQKFNEVVKFLEKYDFKLEKVYSIPSFSILSNLKSTDNLFIKK